jgi:hypothetical protein
LVSDFAIFLSPVIFIWALSISYREMEPFPAMFIASNCVNYFAFSWTVKIWFTRYNRIVCFNLVISFKGLYKSEMGGKYFEVFKFYEESLFEGFFL